MTRGLRQRATAIVEWSAGKQRGVLVHADRKGYWMLPGGGLELAQHGREEEALIATIRELREETGLEARGALFLFKHAGTRNEHHVFLVQAHGVPRVVDQREAPAIGVCYDFESWQVAWTAITPGFDVSGLQPFNSTRGVLQRYLALRAQHPSLWQGLAALEASWGEGNVAPAPAQSAAPGAPATGHKAAKPHRQTTRFPVGEAVLELTTGDIVTQDVDAVVNAANTHLANGGGVCGALHRGAGERELEAACRAIGGCPTGEARITPGFKLTARHIIHVVGPVYNSRRPDEMRRLLTGAYRSGLELASKHGLRSVAFPSLSTGIFGYPVTQAAPVALETVIAYLRAHPEISLVRFVLLGETRDVFEAALERLEAIR